MGGHDWALKQGTSEEVELHTRVQHDGTLKERWREYSTSESQKEEMVA